MQKIIATLIVLLVAVSAFYYWSHPQAPQAAITNDFYSTTTPAVADVAPVSPAAVPAAAPAAPVAAPQAVSHATIKTNLGDITLELFAKDAPNTVANFAKLATSGFYAQTKFHRVIAGFMIQGGDPFSKDDTRPELWGRGGPGYKFDDELYPNNHNVVGTISMANSGPNTNGSQFFINVNNNTNLDGKHTVFGKVTAGMDVVKKIESVQTAGENRPVTPMAIESISVY
jgi:cyclophilin family peptidyl-prolyl cis-trans isomerase